MTNNNDNNKPFVTGFQEIDQQHQQILQTIGSLKDQLNASHSKDQCLKSCRYLIDILRNHYDVEERLMLKYFYPDTEGHIGQHMHYLNLLGKLIKLIKEGDILSAQNTLKFMETWYLDHLLDADRKYTDFINNQSM